MSPRIRIHFPRLRCLVILAVFAPSVLLAQAENVPATHPVFPFLKRLEVMGVIDGYRDAILPLSRKEVASFLAHADTSRGSLGIMDQKFLDDFLSEFAFDLGRSTAGFHRLIASSAPTFGEALERSLSDTEKFLYYGTDSASSVFLNLLLDADGRSGSWDSIGNQTSAYLQLGVRLRGTVFQHLGYYLQWTNAQFWGSRELLARDPFISQSYALYTSNSQNFDFAEGYVRYDAGPISAQVGRERVLWGLGYDQKMTLSDNVAYFDFIRADASFWLLRYTFMHAWLMGPVEQLAFTLPSDTSHVFLEPVAADKYFAAHRLELSIPRLLDFGMQEMVIYSNRSPDLAYLNPLTIIESTQRSRGERDNVFWSFDLQLHVVPHVELMGTLLFDDINVPDLFSDKWTDRYAWQVGMAWADPFLVPSTTLYAEYTRVEPYVFSHGRSRDNSYTSKDVLLGPLLGPNADAWAIRLDVRPLRRLTVTLRGMRQRAGENTVDEAGRLITNVGGDALQPHRDGIDPETKVFLAGELFVTTTVDFRLTWEFLRQMFLDGYALYQSVDDRTRGTRTDNHTIGIRVRTAW